MPCPGSPGSRTAANKGINREEFFDLQKIGIKEPSDVDKDDDVLKQNLDTIWEILE